MKDFVKICIALGRIGGFENLLAAAPYSPTGDALEEVADKLRQHLFL